MTLRRIAGLVLTLLAELSLISCGDVYRPVVIPVSSTPPNPSSFHAVFAISNNAPFNPGTAMQIDVSGDTNIGVANMGVNPTHATILPSNGRVFVASAGSLFQGDADAVISFTPAADVSTPTGLGNPVTFSLPLGSLPVFVHTTQTNAMYVANYGTNSVAALNTSTNSVSRTGTVGSHPVGLSETPNAQNLYVVNEGDNTVTDLSPIDLSTLATIPVGNTPVWAVSRVDSKRVYVVTQGDGQLQTIRTDTNAVISSQPVGGAGANFILYDSIHSRIYVTNPVAQAVYIFDSSSDPPTQLAALSMTAGTSPPCPNGCAPTSVAALPDGSRFYVASYETAPACPDPNVGVSSSCIIPRLTVFDARSMTVKPMSSSRSLLSPSLSLIGQPRFSASQYAVPQVASCAPAASYSPSSTRFRMFAAAAADSSHVYVSICDSGTVADISTSTSTISTGGTNTPDKLVTNIAAPFGACGGPSCPTVANITGFAVTSNVVLFQAANNFSAGQQVEIAGLSSDPGTRILNGQTLTVLATGLTGSTFACTLSGTPQDVPQTSDTGTAVPVPVPQNPIFLLSGQ